MPHTRAASLSPSPAAVPDWTQWTQALDRHAHALVGQAVNGISPIQTGLVYLDWLSHLLISPGKQLDLIKQAAEDAGGAAQRLMQARAGCCDPSAPDDRRFRAPEWQQWPFSAYAQAFHVLERSWDRATRDVPGLTHRHADIAHFAARQWLDVFNPANMPWLNPEVLRATAQEGGANLVRGAMNWADDLQRLMRGLPPAGTEAYRVGENVAVTPGKVVMRNELMELIQYSPATEQVHAEPILIVPAWIMKYYILDLSPHNSLVRYLVSQGHTVFMISWKNPTEEDRNRTLDDYRRLGVMAALDAINRIVPDRKVHATGYCLGGTLLMIAAATMGRDGDERLASMTLFAAQGDFTEAGELLMFINESEVELIEAMMAQQGYLKGSQMAGTFQLLHADDLIWSRAMRHYLLGQRDQPNDLMAWNADTTRMPYRMHSEYLHRLFLHNDLSQGRYEVDGEPIWFTDIRVPCFAVGTVTDHVAPWKSVYKLHLLPLDLTFVLTSGGHNAGIVSEPGHKGRHFQIHHRPPTEPYSSPDRWQAETPHSEGSWWPSWQAWLAEHSSGLVPPPRMGLPGGRRGGKLPDAPGDYVRQS
ncbi:alpha/beta fold hydrolase [Aquabacterium fontiphilum]|uniref:PHA/PHB synthase family protein n=1 Tax=Aquabacterium fontiphilum TaxID=450365 RepID=UPI001378F337|nr:alpha/beta fold hydrolase [Aquabacterium fontiphilum]NBD22018.1 alpha/beta fold hydrolase [Aquabacterium fontiphilum]